MPMADRVVFQMDQTTSADKVFLWQIHECGEDSDMDSDLSLRVSGDNQKAVEYRSESLHFFADFECDGF